MYEKKLTVPSTNAAVVAVAVAVLVSVAIVTSAL